MSLYVPPLFPAEVIDKGGQVYNVKAYGAKGDGISDDTAAIQAAINGAPAYSTVLLPASGVYLVHPSVQPNSQFGALLITKPLTISAMGATIRFADNTLPETASSNMFYISSSPSRVVFRGGVIDGNCANQSLASIAASTYVVGISSYNSAQAGVLVLDGVQAINFTTKAGGAAYSNGIGIDDYGFSRVEINGSLEGESCDTLYWHTTIAAASGLCSLQFDKIICHNCTLYGLYCETAGQVNGDLVLAYNDNAASTIALGVFTGASGDIEDIHIAQITSNNCAALSIGIGGSDHLANSSFGTITSRGCPVANTFYITQVWPSVAFSKIVGDATNAGSILVFAGTDSTHYPIIGDVRIGAPSAGASINANSDPIILNGGYVAGSISSPGIGSQIRHVEGYNPVGLVTVAVPATGVATAALPYDATFYITASTSTVACAVTDAGGTSQTVATIPASGFAGVFVPAGSTLTPTYTAAPTWTVQGH
jgi:hypothetical protein